MSTHYFTHVHGPALPHVKAMIESVRRFDAMAPITVVVDDAALAEFSDWVESSQETDGVVETHSMSDVESACKRDGLDFTIRKEELSPRDYAWMMQACLPYWLMGRIPENYLVYVDSDCYFFQSLQPVIDNMPHKAQVGVCPHRYPRGRENESAGNYNNGMLILLNSREMMEHTKRWGRETIDRWDPKHMFSITHEQKLLDEWPAQLGELLCELPPEVDCGPWRLADMSVHPIEGYPMLPIGEYHEIEGQRLVPLQSWHFHEFRRSNGNCKNPIVINGQQWNRSGYELSPATIEAVYKPYEAAMSRYI